MPKTDPFVEAERFVQTTLARLPRPFSRYLGYREKQQPPAPTYVTCLWGFIGAFGGLGVLFAVFGHTDYFTSRSVPPIIASYGASAILCYGSIDVPLAQPRALVFGHFFSALTGVIIAAIFELDLRHGVNPNIQWLAACLATSIALVVMHLTKTTHPPAGATALLPCVDPGICFMRWYFLPVVILSSALVLVSALLINNLQRQYPKFWIAPIPPPANSGTSQPPPYVPAAPVQELQRRHSRGDLESRVTEAVHGSH